MSRPRLHLAPVSGWVNDPLGLTYRDGAYHAFVQFNPHGCAWAPECHWAHATSPDLLTWTEQPVALSPGDGDAGCWSGCVVTDADVATTLFYTSVDLPDLGLGRVRTAYPDPTWTHWSKGDVVVRPPEDLGLATFRDPFVLRDGDLWRMLVGAGLRDGTATALTFVSADLRRWEYDGLLAGRSVDDHDPVWTGSAWECPQLVQVGGRHALIVSAWHQDELHHVAGALGRYVEGRVDVERWQQLTYGPSHYAASAFRDADGAVSVVTWLREAGSQEGEDGGWAGAMSLPMRLAAPEGRLSLTLHPSVAAARGEPAPDGVACPAWDLEWEPRDGTGEVRIHDARHRPVAVLVVRAGLLHMRTEGVLDQAWEMPVGAAVRVVVDEAILEVLSDGAAVAGRIPCADGSYPVAQSGTMSWWRL
ncbi:MAG: glycoside hydrolase family 32 protein [Actinobacteria bacterium]|nr:glycoside hydrolase family 32 protein [Actinomycetota bacterium]